MNYDFYKYHALGNDYIVIDPHHNDIKLTEQNIKMICHRNFGVGSDGILYGPILDTNNKMSLRIFNPDGSEAEKSGNGVREFSRYLFDAGYVTSKNFTLDTLGGTVKVEYLDEEAHMIKVDMGTVTFKSNEIPTKFNSEEALNQSLQINNQTCFVNCVSIGNPHCVILTDEVTKQKAEAIGPLLENNQMFPNKINVQLLKVMNRNNIQIEIWERGAGYTLASGTSSCAAASVAYKLGLVDHNINVHMPGGMIQINIDNDWRVHMTGSVTAVSYGYFSKDLLKQII